MIYDKGNLKYLLLCYDQEEYSFNRIFTEKALSITGLFQWTKALNGTMDFPKTVEGFSLYNIIHMNVTPRNLTLIPKIRKMMSSHQKLLLNVDYSLELWNNNFNFPDLFFDLMNRGDYIFAVEPYQQFVLQTFLKRPVELIPHPMDLEAIGKHQTADRKMQIGIMIHRYDKNVLTPYYVCEELSVPRNTYTTCALGGSYNKTDVAHLYDMFCNHMSFQDTIKYTATLYAVLESYTISSYGRYSAECAALAVPCIGAKCVDSIARCFPKLATDPNDIKKQRELLQRLFLDPGFYADVCNTAQQNVDYYSHATCRDKLINFLNSPQ